MTYNKKAILFFTVNLSCFSTLAPAQSAVESGGASILGAIMPLLLFGAIVFFIIRYGNKKAIERGKQTKRMLDTLDNIERKLEKLLIKRDV